MVDHRRRSRQPHVDLSGVQIQPRPVHARTGSIEGFTVEIATDKGVKGYGEGGMAGGVIVEKHLTKLLLGKDPFDIERIWDILWRSTMYYDRAGIATNAISGVDLALWDLIGNALACRFTNCSAARPSRASRPTAPATTSNSTSSSASSG